METPYRQIRACYDSSVIRVYQAYSREIADKALEKGTFVSPPFRLERMTWIKPSFLWMMYRSGWGLKDAGQERILAIDMTREGFEWALKHSCLSHAPAEFQERKDGLDYKSRFPVRIQWDPERDLTLSPLEYRAIQMGLSGEAVTRYVGDWIRTITDVTPLAKSVHELVQKGSVDDARKLLPLERPYPVDQELSDLLGMNVV